MLLVVENFVWLIVSKIKHDELKTNLWSTKVYIRESMKSKDYNFCF